MNNTSLTSPYSSSSSSFFSVSSSLLSQCLLFFSPTSLCMSILGCSEVISPRSRRCCFKNARVEPLNSQSAWVSP
ncbi:hypothetical protein E2C01_043421 [Portunus trituberculatus]|uniref:Uncharacterized protein n=1 Tax=Portunus trituberculatus TaxID=210409 RepID=A0A5B7FXA7_PORTR|nr:hypothetical protein [Portunus trituberculatus]